MVAIGTIAIAAMRQVGYSKEFAAGLIANAGTLGILIPPSIVMVVYAAATNVSVGRMFLAGVIPGLVAGLMLMIAIYIVARIKNLPSEPWRGFGEILQGGKEAGWGLFLIIIILGGIYGGVFTPTEAAAVAAVYSFFIALFIYRDMGPMADQRWIQEDDSKRAKIGFSCPRLCRGDLLCLDDHVVLCHLRVGRGNLHRQNVDRPWPVPRHHGALRDSARPGIEPAEHSRLSGGKPADLAAQPVPDRAQFHSGVFQR